LWCFLGGESPEIRTYASGINPKEPEREAEAAWEAGQRAFKLKIGFDADLDRRNIDSLRSMLGPDIHLAVDSNQAWSVERACALAPTLDEYGLAWLEEPLRADRPIEEWRAVAECTRTPLAGGENLRSDESFGAALRAGILAVFQPDVAKWGGITGCLDVAKAALGAGRVYCPHFLGGGIGLHASAHLLAAAGGPGLLEVDINDNKLRELVTPGFPVIADGRIHLSDAPGLGCEPDLEALAPYRVGF
jgi:L-alanine-DL-glutamate epimerase-like enolase superfamily enzyme